MESSEVVHLDSRAIKILAHPLRMRILGLLRVDGPATATELAEKTATNSGATSYHLRQLADVGLVIEEPDMGNRRQRYWSAAHRAMSWRDTDYGEEPDAGDASDWLMRHMHREYGRWVDEWLDVRSEWPKEWRDAVDQSDFGVTVTPGELAELNRRVREIYEEYDSGDPKDGAERVFLITYSVPKRAVKM